MRLGGIVIDIPRGPRQRRYGKVKVEVLQLIDSSWKVYCREKLRAKTDPTPLKEPIRAKHKRKSNMRTASEERRVYMASAA